MYLQCERAVKQIKNIEQMSCLSGHVTHEKNEFESLVCLFNYIRASIRIQFL